MSSRRRLDNIAYWILAILLAVTFALSGWPKINPDPSMVERFAAWGYSASFLLAIGVLETLGALLVLIPRFTTWGALLLAAIMMGATYTHISTGIGSPSAALQYLMVAVALGMLRYRERWRPGVPAE